MPPSKLYTWSNRQNTERWFSAEEPKEFESCPIPAIQFLPWLKNSDIQLEFIDKQKVQILLEHIQGKKAIQTPLCLAQSLWKQFHIKLHGQIHDTLSLDLAWSHFPKIEEITNLCEELPLSPLSEYSLHGQSLFVCEKQQLSLHFNGTALDLSGNALNQIDNAQLPIDLLDWDCECKGANLWHLKAKKAGFIAFSESKQLVILAPLVRNSLNTHLYALHWITPNPQDLMQWLHTNAKLEEFSRAGLSPDNWINEHCNSICLLRKGRLPTSAQDEQISLNPKLEHLHSPESEQGPIDLKDFCLYKELQANEWIASIVPPKEGQAGTDLEGKNLAIPAPNNSKFKIQGDFRVIQDEDGSRHYFCLDTCIAQILEEELWIRPQLYLKEDIGPKTGNIRFNKDIIVQGTIHTGYTVECGGNLLLEQTPSPGSIIHSKGDLICKQGIIGTQTQVLCEGNFQCEFVEDATIVCHGNLVIKHFALNAQLMARGYVQICGEGQSSPSKGAMMGGLANGAKGVYLHSISAEIGCAQVIAGTSIEIERQCENLQHRISELSQKISQLSLECKSLNSSELLQKRDEIYLRKISDHMVSLSKLKDKLSTKWNEQQQKAAEFFSSNTEIGVFHTIHPNCEFQIEAIITIFRYSRTPSTSVAFRLHRNYLVEFPEPDLKFPCNCK